MVSSEDNFLSGSPQYNWLANDLRNADRQLTPWLLVMLHRPVYSSCHGCDNGLRQLLQSSLEPLFRRFNVDLVFAGHVHAYERSCGIAANGTCAARDEDGTVYVTSGGAGNNYQTGWGPESVGHKNAPEWSIFRTENHGISELRANGTHFDMVYVDLKRGEVHDRVSLRK